MMNNFCGVGRLTRDPDTKRTSDVIITNFTIAIDRSFTKQGEERQTDFIPIVVFGKTAEFVEKYFKKGMQVSVVGRIQTRSYDANDGTKKYVTEIIAAQVGFADSKRENEPSLAEVHLNNVGANVEIIQEDDLPF